MNCLDIFLIIMIVLAIIIGFVAIVEETKLYNKDPKEWHYNFGKDANIYKVSVTYALLILVIIFIISLPMLFISIKKSGVTIGQITTIRVNHYGTSTIYIKTSENIEKEFCIENSQVQNQALNYIGKTVRVGYVGKNGYYSSGSCRKMVIININEIDKN